MSKRNSQKLHHAATRDWLSNINRNSLNQESFFYRTSLEQKKLPSTVFPGSTISSNSNEGFTDSIFVQPSAVLGFPAQYNRAQPFQLMETNRCTFSLAPPQILIQALFSTAEQSDNILKFRVVCGQINQTDKDALAINLKCRLRHHSFKTVSKQTHVRF